jgi:NAD(P)H-dependent FMN reductase
MEGEEEIERREISTALGTCTLVLSRWDLSSFYPGMALYTLHLLSGGRSVALFRTNNYEYSPGSPLDAGDIAWKKMDEWEKRLKDQGPEPFLPHPEKAQEPGAEPWPDVLILQGSPRAEGNSELMASWALEEVEAAGLTGTVTFVHDLVVRPCIGCYQCYNTGTCTFQDDMTGIIDSFRHAELLIVCTPVYTSTVPAGLKLIIDRFQAYHAEMILTGNFRARRGLLFSVSGRTGDDNFTCVTRVVFDFMRNIRIRPSGSVLVDGLDRKKDIRTVPGVEEKIRDLLRKTLTGLAERREFQPHATPAR